MCVLYADLFVILETASSLACSEIPQTQSLVPGAGQSEVAIQGQNL